MPELDEIKRLLANFDDDQLACISGIAMKIATVKAESWTGGITLELNVSQGTVGDIFCNLRERLCGSGVKKRRVRSGGIR